MEDVFEGMRITQIIVVTQEGVGIYNAGPDHKIKYFENKSLEYPDHLFSCYWGFDKNNKVIKVIENCPLDITYTPQGGKSHD